MKGKGRMRTKGVRRRRDIMKGQGRIKTEGVRRRRDRMKRK